MPALLITIAQWLVARFVLVAAFMANFWAILVSSTAATWLVRGVVIAAVVLWMPVPEWLSGLPGWIAAIPAEVVWGLGFIELKQGFIIVMGCWLFRFFVRACLKVIGS